MFETSASAFVIALEAYVALGTAFAIVFVFAGVNHVDPTAKGASVAFRFLIFPGSIAFWPMLLMRWARGVHEPPMERNPHS